MTIYETIYSTYEVDEDNKQIRRLTSSHEPTPRQGEDGQWKPYADIFPEDTGMLIVWEYVDGIAKSTLTSPLVLISGQEVSDERVGGSADA